MPPQYAIRTCLACGEQFQILVKAVRRGEGKYCSRQCSGRARSVDLERDFHLRVDRSAGPDSCWPWLGSFDSDGYGRIASSGRAYRAHKMAWTFDRGRAPEDGLVIRHLCPGGGNRWCCNPRHLEEGTVQDNADDAVRSGRQARGERHRRSKLTADGVRDIRRRASSGESCRSIAVTLGLHPSTVERVVSRATWADVDGGQALDADPRDDDVLEA